MRRGAALNEKNKELLTPLHVAADCNHADSVELLLKHGAKVNALDSHGQTGQWGEGERGGERAADWETMDQGCVKPGRTFHFGRIMWLCRSHGEVDQISTGESRVFVLHFFRCLSVDCQFFWHVDLLEIECFLA